MTTKKLTPQMIGAIVLVCAAVAATVRIWHNVSAGEDDGFGRRPHHIKVELLAQEEAHPGKVIRASSQGVELAGYNCSPDDAAVAVISLADTSGEPNIRTDIDDAIDPQGRTYATSMHEINGFYFLTVEKGFSETPTRITVPVQFYVVRGQLKIAVSALVVNFRRIAKPTRILAPPTGARLREAEQIATAEYVEDEGRIVVKVLRPEKSANSTILATSFSSPYSKLNGLTRLSSMGQFYQSDTDAVMVRIDYNRVSESEWILTYKNAEIIVKGGVRVLWLPTTQVVGSINGRSATVLRFNEGTFKGVNSLHPQGDIYVRIARNPGDGKKIRQGISPSEVMGHLSLEEVSPTPQDIGVDWLWIGVDTYGCTNLVKPTGTRKGQLLEKIPELKLRFHLEIAALMKSKVLVLPVHQTKKDSGPFPPDPMRTASSEIPRPNI